jgi:hypothetical protein
LVFTTRSRLLKYVSGEQLDTGMLKRAAEAAQVLGVGERFLMSEIPVSHSLVRGREGKE